MASITKSAPKENYQGLVVQRAIERWGIQAPGGKQANRHDVNCALARTWSNYAGTVLEEGRSGQAWHAAMTSLKITIVQTAAWKILVKAALLRIYELPKRGR